MEVGSVNHTFENIGSGCVERNESMKRESHILFFVHFFKIVVRRAIIYHEWPFVPSQYLAAITTVGFQNILSPEKEALSPFPLAPGKPRVWFPSSWICLLLDISHKSYNARPSCVWLVSRSIAFLRLIYSILGVSTSFLSRAEKYSIICRDHISLLWSAVYGHLGWFCLWTVVTGEQLGFSCLVLFSGQGGTPCGGRRGLRPGTTASVQQTAPWTNRLAAGGQSALSWGGKILSEERGETWARGGLCSSSTNPMGNWKVALGKWAQARRVCPSLIILVMLPFSFIF